MIGIVDYAAGNVYNVQKAFAHLGADTVLTADKQKLRDARAIVLPGVGSFDAAMKSLLEGDLVELLRDEVQKGKPFLGICLGQQLLMERSDEGGALPGLAILKGETKKLTTNCKIPHMGWNSLQMDENCPLFRGLNPGAYVYFVHSYSVVPADERCIAARCDYGQDIAAALWQDNVLATQFHPEKSASVGLKMLQNFTEGLR